MSEGGCWIGALKGGLYEALDAGVILGWGTHLGGLEAFDLDAVELG